MISKIRQAIRECGEYRFGRWGTFRHRFAVAPWRWSAELCKFKDHWALHAGCLWVNLWATREEPEGMMESWGFSYDREFSALHLNWGARCKIVRMPWSYDHCRTEVMLRDGSFVPYEKYRRGSLEPAPEPAGLYREAFPYRYGLRSGEVQEVTATVTAERRSWCWRAWPFRLLRWPSRVRTSIDVEFSDEVGEQRGSWKGGCVGCGWGLLPGETPEQSLRRMERERRFE